MISSIEDLKALELLSRSNYHGVTLTIANGNLAMRFPRDKQIDQGLIADLKRHKRELTEFLTNLKEGPQGTPLQSVVAHDGDLLYPVSAVQLYWLDDEIDRRYKLAEPRHGSIYITYEVRGNFNPEMFKRAIGFLCHRHEGLRSNFHFIDGRYYMKVEDVTLRKYEVETMDVSVNPADQDETDRFIMFENHTFDLGKGPLFIVRILKIATDRFVVSIKVHHVVFDTWSEKILIRDLLAAYQAFLVDRVPQLPQLKYQMKDYMSMMNLAAEQYFDHYQQYWKRLVKDPVKMVLPGSADVSPKRDIAERMSNTRKFALSKERIEPLQAFARDYSVSLFVILQAAFKAFLFRTTGQKDFLIGTYIFGREHIGTEDQIGCYAKTVLIRTILDPLDRFHDVIVKVAESNNEMRNYNIQPLQGAFERMKYQEENIVGSSWNVNILFNDTYHGYLAEEDSGSPLIRNLELDFTTVLQVFPSYMVIDLQLNFMKSDKTLDLFVQFDTSAFTTAAVTELIGKYFEFIDIVTRRKNARLCDL